MWLYSASVIVRVGFQAAVMSILLYGCTTYTLSYRIEKKHDSNCTTMLPAILNKSWRQHRTKQQLNGYLPPISKTIQIRHAGHSRRSKDELWSDVLLWTPLHGRSSVGRPARINQQHLCTDSGCRLENLSEAMDHTDGWRSRAWERERERGRES